MSFYQTTDLTDSQLITARIIARSQDDQILHYMTVRGGDFTAWQLKEVFPNWEITSIRRSLNTLELKRGLIMKTGEVMDIKGRPCGTYSVIYLQGNLF